MDFTPNPEENSEYEAFYLWKEKYCKQKGIPVITGFVIINEFISKEDALSVCYSLN
jgi:hypothetical protein